jgi:hypothetical protein
MIEQQVDVVILVVYGNALLAGDECEVAAELQNKCL